MKERGGFVSAGGFSLINGQLLAALRRRIEIEAFDAVQVAVVGRPWERLALSARAVAAFLPVILRHRIPPRDLVVRLPAFSAALKRGMARRSEGLAWTLQTQSLFDASGGRVPHFVYTDHTFLANRRYPVPRATWPVAPGWRELECAIYRNARLVFTSSRFAADSLVEDYGLPPERAVVVGSGGNVPVPPVCPSRVRSGGARILFVGVEWERKGGPELLEAVAQLRRTRPDVALDVVGCAGAAEGVRFHGRVPPSDVARFYQEADIFCLPSRAEPSAGVLAEAAAYGLPIVATRVGGTPERVIDGGTGFLVPAMDAEALGRSLARLVDEPDLASRMGRAGWELAAREFTWDAVAAKMLAAIDPEMHR